MSVIVISVGGNDVTNNVIAAPTTFESLAAAQPGTCELHLRDFDQTLSFTTGDAITVTLDSAPLWTGYVINISQSYAAPVLDTVTVAPSAVTGRIWILRGVDLNILFDKRIIRNTADYLQELPFFDVTRYDGDLITNVLSTYLDISGDSLDVSTYVDDVIKPGDPEDDGLTGTAAWPYGQSAKWREQMDFLISMSGAVYYLDAGRNLHYHAWETVEATWGFSDTPNGTTTIGPREVKVTEDGSVIANDAFVWGGSEWSDGVVFARKTDAASIAAHGRWQTNDGGPHFGEDYYKNQHGVDARAEVIVEGAPNSVTSGPQRGLKYSQYKLDLTWFSTKVPSNQHLIPGQIVTSTFTVLGITALALPLRRVKMSFPTLNESGDPYVKFEGSLSLQQNDPQSLWVYLRATQRERNRLVNQNRISTADNTVTAPVYGALYGAAPIPAPDGATTVFTLDPDTLAYIGGTTDVYSGGLHLIPGVDYTESDPNAGEITFASAPAGSAQLWVTCRLA